MYRGQCIHSDRDPRQLLVCVLALEISSLALKPYSIKKGKLELSYKSPLVILSSLALEGKE